MVRSTKILQSKYCDSVVLMRVASQLKKIEAVSEVAMFMGTEGNHDLLHQAGLATAESKQAGPNDLIIVAEAANQELCTSILGQAETMINEGSKNTETTLDYKPRTLETALRMLPDASLAAISVPGEYAARETHKCLSKGLNVFLFSDNVPLEDELKLKQLARKKNLLLMGPDCGTSYINGTALGFANVVRPGPIGCIAASGTGLQAVVCCLARMGVGISHAIGVGGRDLSRDIDGTMTKYCLELLEDDPNTEVIVLISKPPHEQVIRSLQEICSDMTTPVIACFQGADEVHAPLLHAVTLDEAAHMAAALQQKTTYTAKPFTDPEHVRSLLTESNGRDDGKRIIGLFAGGTLAKEAHLLLSEVSAETAMNREEDAGHFIIDLGDDQYTVGRPHPMLAPEIRSEKLIELAERGSLASCGVLLFDLVLGNGSHHDPATVLADSIAVLRDRYAFSGAAIAAVIGTGDDPQDFESQKSTLQDAGITVFDTNSEAVRMAVMLTNKEYREHLLKEMSR